LRRRVFLTPRASLFHFQPGRRPFRAAFPRPGHAPNHGAFFLPAMLLSPPRWKRPGLAPFVCLTGLPSFSADGLPDRRFFLRPLTIRLGGAFSAAFLLFTPPTGPCAGTLDPEAFFGLRERLRPLFPVDHRLGWPSPPVTPWTSHPPVVQSPLLGPGGSRGFVILNAGRWPFGATFSLQFATFFLPSISKSIFAAGLLASCSAGAGPACRGALSLARATGTAT